MTTRMTAIIACVGTMLAATTVPTGAANAAEIRVLSTVGVKAVLDELIPAFERQTGNKVVVEFNSSASLKKRIDAGEAFDLTIIVAELVDDLAKQGKVAADSRKPFARTGVGVAIKAGAPRPDIGTLDAFKRALINAKSIALSDPAMGGASSVYFVGLTQRLGIFDDIKSKLKPTRPGALAPPIASGEAEFGIGQISEIVPEHGIELLGPFPAEVQTYTTNSAGVSTHVADAAATKALVDFISAPAAAPVLKAKGMEPG